MSENEKRKRTGGGSRKGIPNVATANAREAIAKFVDGNADRLQGWLDAIAEDKKQGPRAAFECFKDLLEYHVPKLARTEITGEGGKPLEVRIVRFSDPTPEQLDAAGIPDAGVAGARTGNQASSTMLAPTKRQG